MNRKLRMGMVGGGKDAFIGAIHRLAANMDGLIELSCGALSINPEIAVFILHWHRGPCALPRMLVFGEYAKVITAERFSQGCPSN